MEFKVWFLLKGFTITPWLLFLVSIALTISAKWPAGRRARLTMALTFAMLATVILIVLVLPFNWTAIYNTTGF